MSPLLANTHPASTHVSISGQQAPTKATAVLLPALGCPRVVITLKFDILQRCRGRRGFLIVICTMKQEPQDDDNNNDNDNKVEA